MNRQVNINLEELERYGCACGNDTFRPATRIFAVPETLQFATNGSAELQVQFWECLRCGKAQAPGHFEKLPPIKFNQPEMEAN